MRNPQDIIIREDVTLADELAEHGLWLQGKGGRRADLRYADLGSANLGYADLGSADLGYADLGYADLRYANLGSADLGYANLRYANLGYANLGYADLRSANLRSANLGYANLGYANLRYADLRYANLGSADLGSADLRSANLSECSGIGWALLGPVDDVCKLNFSAVRLNADGKAVETGGTVHVSCGCHTGTVEETRARIAWAVADGEVTKDEAHYNRLLDTLLTLIGETVEVQA